VNAAVLSVVMILHVLVSDVIGGRLVGILVVIIRYLVVITVGLSLLVQVHLSMKTVCKLNCLFVLACSFPFLVKTFLLRSWVFVFILWSIGCRFVETFVFIGWKSVRRFWVVLVSWSKLMTQSSVGVNLIQVS